MKTYYRPLIEILKEYGYELSRNCKSSHEVWARDGKEIILSRTLNDRNLANKILKHANIDRRFG